MGKQAELSDEARGFVSEETKGLEPYNLTLKYDFWTASELCSLWFDSEYRVANLQCLGDIIQATLPEELRDGAPVGFAATGHVGESVGR